VVAAAEVIVLGATTVGFDSPVLLVSWEVWNERNTWTFRNEISTSMVVTQRIHGEGAQWIDMVFLP